MTINKKSLACSILTILIVINCLAFFSKKGFDIYEKLAFFGNFIGLIIILYLYNQISKKDLLNIGFFLIFAFYTLTTLFINDGGIGSVITPLLGFLTLIVFKNIPLSNNNFKIILVALIILNLFLVINSNDYFEKSFANLGQYINSNTIGMVLFYTAIYIKILLKMYKFKYHTFITLVFYILSIYALLNTQSRGAIMALLLFIILDTFVPKRFWKSRLRLLLVFVVVIISGTIFPYIYTLLYKNNIELTLPFTAKSLYTGREDIWNNFFITMSLDLKNWFLGLGSKVELWENKDLNLHNNYLAILTNFGIIGFALYYGFIIKELKSFWKNINLKDYQISSLIGFLCILLYGFIEVTTLWYIMFFFNFLFFGIIKNDLKEKNN